MNRTNRREIPGIAPAVAGLTMLLSGAIGRALLTADDAAVYLAGRPIGWPCSMRAQFGLPCPTCGLSRSVVLSLHGEFAAAWGLTPAGPLFVAALAGIGVALLALACAEWLGFRRGPEVAARWMRRGSLAYAGAAAAVWMVAWMASLSNAISSR
ncbi:MAG: DUF2752 domain-containing protein [Bryobacteraceae bacterium]|nr:DUF2752 domain-containing protein [Bryobacteraceae bacterium]